MLNLAANWSPALKALSRRVTPPLNALKAPLDALTGTAIAEARSCRTWAQAPFLLHGWGPSYRVGLPEIPSAAALAKFAVESRSPYLSVHLDLQPEDLSIAPLRRVTGSVRNLCAASGLPVLLENMPHYRWSERSPFVTDPAFISEAVSVSGAGFLLDLGHARVAAAHRGEDELGYIMALPLFEAVEIHLSGPRLEADGLRDRHFGLSERDWELLDVVLTRAPKLSFLTLEYGGIPDSGFTSDGRAVRLSRNSQATLLEQLGRLDGLRKREAGLGSRAPVMRARPGVFTRRYR